MGFIDWLLDIKKDEPKQEPVQQIIIHPIITKKKRIKKVVTPATDLTFDDYIGQSKAKDILKAYLDSGVKVLPHILISGNAGHGKTTLSRIIASTKGVKFIEIMAQSITSKEHLVQLVKASAGGILFIDEIHGLSRDTVEVIYSMMEDFKCDGERISHFTLIGATTEYGELLKDRRPFVDRFKINLELAPYSINEIARLTENRALKGHLKANKSDFNAIASNSKLVPRTAIRLLEATHTFGGNVNKAIYSYNIVKDGLTEKDIKVLKYLATNRKAGINSISAYLNTPIQSYRYEIEPYLLQIGYILVVPGGRQITQLGKQFLGGLKP